MDLSKLSRVCYRNILYSFYVTALIFAVYFGAGFLWSTVIAVVVMCAAHLVMGRVEFGRW